jgi:RNA polymerase sigma-70 factor, ECF subfamily
MIGGMAASVAAPLGSSDTARHDQVVLDAIARGDLAAFRRVYDRLQPKLHRIAFAVLLDCGEADDVIQEVFLKLHRQAARWSPQIGLEPLLFRATLNSALSLLRRLARFRRSWKADAGVGSSPEHVVAARQGIALMRSALEGLSGKQRAVVALHLDAGLEPSDIARLVGATPNATRVTLHRALSVLRQTLIANGVNPLQEGES